MRPLAFDPATTPTAGLAGAVVAEEVRLDGKRRFHKGHRLTAADLADLPRLDRTVHLVRLDPGEVHEDEAGLRLARAAAGPGPDIALRGPVQSRVNIVTETKGLLRIDREAIIAINSLPGMALFTLPDRLAVLPGTVLAGAKITPVAIDEATLAAAETIATAASAMCRPVVQLKPFQPLTVGVVSTEGLADAARDRFQAAVLQKIAWFGGDVLGFADVREDAMRFAKEIEAMVGRGADVILTGGGNTIDPLDPSLLALPLIGAEMVKFGAAAHPGSMFWLAYMSRANGGAVPIFNLASCSLYSRATVADLVLPWVFAGERVTLRDLAELGVGGLLDKDAAFRFPPYGETGGEGVKNKEVQGTDNHQ